MNLNFTNFEKSSLRELTYCYNCDSPCYQIAKSAPKMGGLNSLDLNCQGHHSE